MNEHQQLWGDGTDALPPRIFLDHILDNLHPLALPPPIVRIFARILREELANVLQRVLDFSHFRTHGIIQGRQVDRVAPIMVDRDAWREVLNLRHSQYAVLHWPHCDVSAPGDTSHLV